MIIKTELRAEQKKSFYVYLTLSSVLSDYRDEELKQMNAEIKLLTEEDLPLMKDVLEDDEMVFDLEKLKEYIALPQNKGFIVKVDHQIVGFSYCYELVRPDAKVMLYIHSIGLLPMYQDQGLGTKLLAYIKQYAIASNYAEMFIITDKGNFRACHLYEKLGGKNDYEDEIVYVYDFEKNSGAE